ncbi:bifunctional folylpolyglutamate synthase/dihydrofolate synthase [Zeaxanthinibacter sp. PT1]|uniref:bifunctional folylpolyglutamate synthase/dihydrofolate synthase n=1 Tax=Zeaxanthinibacter TaxID=561554 RepID=UPI00234A8B20|nr:folylpolyglutamate synthase/dihydrofolate synthase family protein [Zeaxanthinibacter sp. PT1]MDC6352694.1 bifunctional folylpolyglutamate synthase/dihydrofolate synthase [Zeaxanthinibacter sp. PT1]
MTYQETLDWMFSQLPMYQQKGASAYNGKLDNIRCFSDHLDKPELKFKSIHVAGTNGKGSSSHLLASVLQEAGYKVGLYTSPHLKDFRERIRINGTMIAEERVVDFIRKNKVFLDEKKLSFFEMTVGMAFNHFAREGVDIAVIEVGLGGRLDSTNIITPEVSLITNIGLDHTEMLGDSISKITREKAGIIKPGIPVVVSEWQEEAAPVYQAIAKELGSKLVYADKEVTNPYKTALLGAYQEKNMKGVIKTLRQLENFTVSPKHIAEGFLKVIENTGLKGRWQIVQQSPKLIYDTAHNKEGLALTMQQLLTEEYDVLHLVLGFVKEKNLDLILPLFPKNAKFYFSRPDIPRGLDSELLREKAAHYGLRGDIYTSVPEALEYALSKAAAKDLIYVGGSTFTVADVL